MAQLNKTHSKKIDNLNDSLAYFKSQIKNEDYLRALVINKYLRKKTFKVKYYNERVGVGPQGYSFTSIAEINSKYYIGDISNGGKQTIKLADNNQQFFYNSCMFNVEDNLEFNYTGGDKPHRGTISYQPIEWRDFEYSDSSYLCSVIVAEDQLKIPIGSIELESNFGPSNYMIYYLIGKSTFDFNGKLNYAYNPIILESNHVKIIMTENN